MSNLEQRLKNNREQQLKVLVDVFTRNVERAMRYVSGRALSLAELGAIREQCAAVLRAAYLRGMVSRFNRLSAAQSPWDPDNDPTDPYVRSTPKDTK